MIHYVKGDATEVRGGRGIIAHVCNNAGGWGAGFVLAISRRWSEPERRYRQWAKDRYEADSGVFQLGHTQFVSWEPGQIWVANMVAQDGFGGNGRIPLQYNHLEECLLEVAAEAERAKMHVQMPRIGCGLAGGTWDKVEPLIEKAIARYKCDVYVYDLP